VIRGKSLNVRQACESDIFFNIKRNRKMGVGRGCGRVLKRWGRDLRR